jgi:hypothetical protein
VIRVVFDDRHWRVDLQEEQQEGRADGVALVDGAG